MSQIVDQTFIDNHPEFVTWIDTYLLPRYGSRPMQVGDLYIDDYNDNFYAAVNTTDEWNVSYTGAASGNNSGNTTFVVQETINTAHTQDGVLMVDNGAGRG